MGLRAGPHALVAASALFQVQNQQALRLVQPLIDVLLERHPAHGAGTLAIRFDPLLCQRLQPLANFGMPRDHLVKRELRHHYQLNMIQRRAGGCALDAAKQSDLAEDVAAGKVRQDQTLAVTVRFLDLDVAHANQIEGIGRVALPEDHLAGVEGDQLDALAQIIDEFIRHIAENRVRSQVVAQRPLAVFPLHVRV